MVDIITTKMPVKWQIINGVKYPINDGMTSQPFKKNIWRDTPNEHCSLNPVFTYGGKEWTEYGELSFEEAKKYIGKTKPRGEHLLIQEICPQIITLGKKIAATQIQRTWRYYKYERGVEIERKLANIYKKVNEEVFDTKVVEQWKHMPKRKGKRSHQEWSATRGKIIKPLMFKGNVQVKRFNGNDGDMRWMKTEKRDGTHTIRSYFSQMIVNFFEKGLPFNNEFWMVDNEKSEYYPKLGSMLKKVVKSISKEGKYQIIHRGSPIVLDTSHLRGIKMIQREYELRE